MKAVQHEHGVSVDVKVNPELQKSIDELTKTLGDQRKTFVLGGMVGVVVGVVGSRLFTRPVINVTVNPE